MALYAGSGIVVIWPFGHSDESEQICSNPISPPMACRVYRSNSWHSSRTLGQSCSASNSMAAGTEK